MNKELNISTVDKLKPLQYKTNLFQYYTEKNRNIYLYTGEEGMKQWNKLWEDLFKDYKKNECI